MGLKAIAVTGTGIVKADREEEFQKAARQTTKHIMENVKCAGDQRGNVLPDLIERYQTLGCLPYKNCQEGTVPHWRNICRKAAQKYYTKKEGRCHACPISCFKFAEVNEGKWSGVKVSRWLAPGVIQE